MGELDARAAAAALKVNPGILADVMRREAARMFVAAADALVREASMTDVCALIAGGSSWIDRANACEDEWLRDDREKSNEATGGATEATPLHLPDAVAAGRDSTARGAS